jgi:hypothetical protein
VRKTNAIMGSGNDTGAWATVSRKSESSGDATTLTAAVKLDRRACLF